MECFSNFEKHLTLYFEPQKDICYQINKIIILMSPRRCLTVKIELKFRIKMFDETLCKDDTNKIFVI